MNRRKGRSSDRSSANSSTSEGGEEEERLKQDHTQNEQPEQE